MNIKELVGLVLLNLDNNNNVEVQCVFWTTLLVIHLMYVDFSMLSFAQCSWGLLSSVIHKLQTCFFMKLYRLEKNCRKSQIIYHNFFKLGALSSRMINYGDFCVSVLCITTSTKTKQLPHFYLKMH